MRIRNDNILCKVPEGFTGRVREVFPDQYWTELLEARESGGTRAAEGVGSQFSCVLKKKNILGV